VEKLRMRYVESGSGSALVMIHGNAGSIDDFEFGVPLPSNGFARCDNWFAAQRIVCSEWDDINFSNETLNVSRAIDNQVVETARPKVNAQFGPCCYAINTFFLPAASGILRQLDLQR
jgi:hypothetical protein